MQTITYVFEVVNEMTMEGERSTFIPYRGWEG